MRHENRCQVLKDHHPKKRPALSSVEGAIQVTSGPFLCRLRVWSEEEWKRLPENDRPREYVHAPGLGWVGAMPEDCLN